MIEQIENSQAGFIGLRATGRVTDNDYKTVLIPLLESAIKSAGKIRLLFELDDTFVGYDLEAICDDAAFGLKHKNDFSKIAIVGGPPWIKLTTKLANYFISADVKYFGSEYYKDASQWLVS